MALFRRTLCNARRTPQPDAIIEGQRRAGPDAFPFERFVPAFDLSVRLRIVGRRSDVGHARDPNELLEVLGDELRPVVGDDPWLCFRMQLDRKSTRLNS